MLKHGMPHDRKHSNILCNCADCQRFDHQSTLVLQRPVVAARTGRKHFDITCTCPDCQKFDYQNTAIIYRPQSELETTLIRQWSINARTGERYLTYQEPVSAIDTETGERYHYLLEA